MSEKGIRVADVKLLESERMTDNPDGGGRASGREVQDGATNNIFPDVSRLDRAYGRVSLRKTFAAIDTEHTETYYGAHAIVGERPSDERVGVLLFDTRSPADTRQNAREYIEAYMIAGPERRYHIVGPHLAGQRTLSLSAPLAEDEPNIGEVLALEEDGTPLEYIRITGVDSEVEEYTEAGETFRRRSIRVDLGQPLVRERTGAQPRLSFEDHGAPTRFRSTVVADAARYYGAGQLAADVAPEEQAIRVRTPYAPLVPATEHEEPVTDERAAREQDIPFNAGGEELELPGHRHSLFIGITQETRGLNHTAYLWPRPVPGTLSVYWRGMGNWERLRDEEADGTLSGAGHGTIDYDTGALAVTLQELPDTPSELLIQWGSETHFIDRSGTEASVDNRPPLLTENVGEPILPGSLRVEWVAGDTVRSVTDGDGDTGGDLSGDGTGRVAYTSGDLSVAPDQWPDPGTTVWITYDKATLRREVINPVDPPEGSTFPASVPPGSGIEGADKSGGGKDGDDLTFADVNKGTAVSPITYTVEHPPIMPGTLQLHWTVGRGTDFVEHFKDIFSHEHALKRILTRDRDNDLTVGESEVTPGAQTPMPNGAREVYGIEDRRGQSVPSDWYEVIKGERQESGYRYPEAIEWTDAVTFEPVEKTDGTSMNVGPEGVQPGTEYLLNTSDPVEEIVEVIAGSGTFVPREHWYLSRGDYYDLIGFNSGVGGSTQEGSRLLLDSLHDEQGVEAGRLYTVRIQPDDPEGAIINKVLDDKGEALLERHWEKAINEHGELAIRFVDDFTRRYYAGSGHDWLVVYDQPDETYSGFNPDDFEGDGTEWTVFYKTTTHHRAPLTVKYRPDGVEASEVLARTLHSVYFAKVDDIDETELMSQASNVGEFIRTATDDGDLPTGRLRIGTGASEQPAVDGGVDYATGEITWRPTANYTYERAFEQTRTKLGREVLTQVSEAVQEMGESPAIKDYLFGHDITSHLVGEVEAAEAGEVFVSSPVTVEYIEDDVTTVQSREVALEPPPLILNLLPRRQEEIIPGTLRFRWGGDSYWDENGAIYREEDGQRIQAGEVDYADGTVTLENIAHSGGATVQIDRMVTSRETPGESQVYFRTPGSPVRPGSLSISAVTVSGEHITAQAMHNGLIQTEKMHGFIDAETGIVYLAFGEEIDLADLDTEDPPAWFHEGLVYGEEGAEKVYKPIRCQAGSIRFNAVIVQYLPLEASVLGLDPVRLPQDGRVPMYRPGDVLVIADPQTHELETGATAGDTYQLPRDDLGSIEVRDHEDTPVPAEMYETDLSAGTVTLTDAFSTEGLIEPLQVIHRKEEMALAADVQISGRIGLSRPLKRGFTAGATVASAMIIGDLNARVERLFADTAWAGEWRDEPVEAPAAQYNRTNFPLALTNRDAITERWAVHFTSTDEFELIAETLGIVARGNTSQDLAPENPATGRPYFTLDAEGWGTGWSPGNVLRFDTRGAQAPMWMIRTVLQGETDVNEDRFTIQVRGDAN
ncbi:MAG: hypothetical protein ACLFSR_03910 [Halomonas sp.]